MSDDKSKEAAEPSVEFPAALDENLLADHCEKYMMADDNEKSCKVFSAVLGGIHVYVFPPSTKLKRNFYTLVTMGVSGTEMNVPPHIENGEAFAHCELMCYLPPDWIFPAATGIGDADEQRKLDWPIAMLRSIGGYIVDTKAWFSQDHGMPSITGPTPGAAFASNTKLSAVVTLCPAIEDPAFSPVICKGKQVNFLLCVPVTAAEAQWKRDVGVEDSVYHFVGDRRVNKDIPVDYVIDAQRPCCVEDLGYREEVEQNLAEQRAQAEQKRKRKRKPTE